MRVVPVVAGRNFLRPVIVFLQFLRFQELGDGFFCAPGSHERMTVHVVRVWNCRSHARIEGAFLKGVLRPPHVFVSVSAIVMRSEISRSNRQRGSIKRECVYAGGLAMSKGTGLIRQPTLDPQPRVVGIRFESLVDRLAVSGVTIGIPGVLDEFEFAFPDGEPRPLAITHPFFQCFRAFKRGPRRLHVLQANKSVSQTEVSHRQVWIHPQGLVKRTRRFNPNVGMQVGKPLIV